MQIEEMNANARQAADLLKSIANEHRLMILCQLAGGEKSVAELDKLIGIRQPNLSQHLARLRAEGIVETRRDGSRIFYRLTSDKAGHIVTLVYNLYCSNVTGLAEDEVISQG
jgi:ArsR family transcriptional regulator